MAGSSRSKKRRALATRKTLAILFDGLAAILTRLALLPVLAVPIPAIHDEFQLLARSRHVRPREIDEPPASNVGLLRPHFMCCSIRPMLRSTLPRRVAVLALGQILGHPWIGSLLSMAGYVHGHDVDAAGLVSRFPGRCWRRVRLIAAWMFRHWVDGYFGGAVAARRAFGLGCFSAVVHFRRLRDAILMGMGAALLASSRPVEGLIFCVPIAGGARA